MTTLLNIQNLNTYYGKKQALYDINMEIRKGEIIGIVGHNGAGKSTLFKSILGINKSVNGEIIFLESDFDLKNDIGYLPEERGLFDKMKVKDQIMFFGSLKGKQKSFLTENMLFWANYFGLNDSLEKKLYMLSKGNQQKIQFIIAVIHNPKLLILDEPFSGLDPLNMDLFQNAINLMKEKKTTILYSSHRLDCVEKLSQKIIFLKDGYKLYDDDIDNIRKKYPSILEVKNESLNIDFLNKKGFQYKIENGVCEIYLENEKDAECIYESLTNKYSEIFYIRKNDINEIFKDIYALNDEGGDDNE